MSASLHRHAIAVIGGGLGGLSAAIHLASRGHRVTLFERNDTLGGKASRWEAKGYSFDTGPSLLTMPAIIDELFAAAGEDRAEHLGLKRLDVQCRYFFPDGRRLDLVDSRDATLANVAATFPGDHGRFGAFLDTARAIYDVTGKPFLDHPYESFLQFGKHLGTNPLTALKWGVLQGTLGDVANRALGEEGLRWLVHRYATYAGGGPAASPAAFAMILHIESALGAWYPDGGVYGLVKAIAALATRAGVDVRTSADVEGIVVRNGKVTGVRVNGREEAFDAVVSNADPIFVGQHLLEPDVARRAGLDKHARQELGLSGLVLMMGVRGRLDHLAHHDVVFPAKYANEFADLFKHRQAPTDPTVYLCIPSRTDPTRAPDGCESVFTMINAPATAGTTDWRGQLPAFVERMKTAVERVIPDLRSRLEVEHVIGPDELRGRYNAPGGSIYGVSPHGRLSPFHRPLPRAEGLRGLYFAGGGTHPGGGIPLVVRSGKFAADLLERDFGHRSYAATTEARP